MPIGGATGPDLEMMRRSSGSFTPEARPPICGREILSPTRSTRLASSRFLAATCQWPPRLSLRRTCLRGRYATTGHGMPMAELSRNVAHEALAKGCYRAEIGLFAPDLPR